MLAGRAQRTESKVAAKLAGRSLGRYAVDAVSAVCARVVVVTKRETALPGDLEAVERWNEPDQPRHPLAGIAHALERAAGPVLVCAADMPFVTAAACRELLVASRAGAVSAVAAAPGGLEPLLGVYCPESAAGLLAAARAGAPARESVSLLEPIPVELPDALVRSVNTPEDLSAAAVELQPCAGPVR